MRIKRLFQMGGVLLTLLALYTLLATPASASAQTMHTRAASPITSVNANVYLTSDTLQPIFQSNLNARLPQMVSSAIASMVDSLPKQNQGWAAQMASALLQPSTELVSLAPQPDGLMTTFKLNLYAGDPRPTLVHILIGFSVNNATTIQVTALPSPNGGQSLISGPLTTIQVPIGSLNAISTTPNCGKAYLNVNLKLPLALDQQGSTSGQAQPTTAFNSIQHSSLAAFTPPAPEANAYIEIPASSLAQLGGSIGSLPVSSSLTASNIRVGVQGSNLVLISDIAWHGLGIGTAVSTLAPGASNGSLVVHVSNTNLQILGGLISFPVNKYNQQIEQLMNAKLNSALAGKFTVSQATVGPNPNLPCAASTSLVLTGTLMLS